MAEKQSKVTEIFNSALERSPSERTKFLPRVLGFGRCSTKCGGEKLVNHRVCDGESIKHPFVC